MIDLLIIHEYLGLRKPNNSQTQIALANIAQTYSNVDSKIDKSFKMITSKNVIKNEFELILIN